MRNEIRARIRATLTRIWWLILLRGVWMLLLGLFLVLSPAATLAALSLFLGAYWFVQGLCAIAGLFVKASDTFWGWLLLDGVFGVLAGILVMNHRMFVPATLVVLLAIQAFLMGAVDLVQGFRGDGARAILLGGLNILFGILLLGHPLAAASFLSEVLGVFAILGGIALITLTLRARGTVRKCLVPADEVPQRQGA